MHEIGRAGRPSELGIDTLIVNILVIIVSTFIFTLWGTTYPPHMLKTGNVSCCATLADWAIDSNASVQTDPLQESMCDTFSPEITPRVPATSRAV